MDAVSIAEMTDQERAEAAHEHIRALAGRTADQWGYERDDVDGDEELAAAGEWVARWGSLGDRYDGDNLTRIQFAARIPHALGQLGHWSVKRNDPEVEPPGDYEVHVRRCETCCYLEGVYGLYRMFEHELCHSCDLDLDGHDIGVMGGGLGTFHALCREPWTREEPLALEVDATDLGAAVPVGRRGVQAWSATWSAPLADGTTAVVTRAYYHSYDQGTRLIVERQDTYGIRAGDPWLINDQCVYSEVESDDPAGENLQELAEQSFTPERGEWDQHMGETAEFVLGGES